MRESKQMIKSYIVDAFTNQAFRGNSAAVCLLEEALDEKTMQSIAAEFNLSETAFLVRTETNHWNLRWFTPTTEVNLCGHATLAAAYVLSHELKLDVDLFRFHTKSGELTAKRLNNQLELNFPRTKTDIIFETDLIQSVASNFISLATAGEDLLIELLDERSVREYEPNFLEISKLPCRGLMITAKSQSLSYDFVSRFFAPRFGINEDPVTGSAHCALIDYWNRKTGKEHFIAKQLSKREGILDIRLLDNRVTLCGDCVTTAKVELFIEKTNSNPLSGWHDLDPGTLYRHMFGSFRKRNAC